MEKKGILKEAIRHVDIKKINSVPIIDAMRGMSFSSRDTARAADIFDMMLSDRDSIIKMATVKSHARV